MRSSDFNPTSTTHLSRLLATVASQDPPDPQHPAILYRENTPASARPLRALSRSPFRYHLTGTRTPDGSIYFWRRPDAAPAVLADGLIRVADRPYRAGQPGAEHVRWCPVPTYPNDPKDSDERLRWLSNYPQATIRLRSSCHPSLRSYYASTRPEYEFTFRDGSLYATNPATPAVPPSEPLPDFYRPDGPPPVPKRTRPAKDAPPPDGCNLYLRRTCTKHLLHQAFPATHPEILTDIQGSSHDRYFCLPYEPTGPSALTPLQVLFVAQEVTLCTGPADRQGRPAYLQETDKLRFSPIPYRQYRPQPADADGGT